jgi:uncharacterized protein YkwD
MRLLPFPALCLVFLFVSCTTASTPIPPVPTPTGGAGASSGESGVDLVRYTNDARAREGLTPLNSSSRLMEAARIHANQMAETGRMEHTISGAQYPTMQSRLAAVGYSFWHAAENIAWNARSSADAVDGWMKSPPHRANILDPRLTEMGAAVTRAANGQTYWVQVFGVPRLQ